MASAVLAEAPTRRRCWQGVGQGPAQARKLSCASLAVISSARSYTARDERRAPQPAVGVGTAPKSVAHGVSTWVLDYLFTTVVASIIAPILLAWFSPSAWTWLYSFPIWAKLAGTGALVVLLLLAWRVSHRRALDRRELNISIPPAEWGYEELERVPHESAVWIVEAPSLPPEAACFSRQADTALASSRTSDRPGIVAVTCGKLRQSAPGLKSSLMRRARQASPLASSTVRVAECPPDRPHWAAHMQAHQSYHVPLPDLPPRHHVAWTRPHGLGGAAPGTADGPSRSRDHRVVRSGSPPSVRVPSVAPVRACMTTDHAQTPSRG